MAQVTITNISGEKLNLTELYVDLESGDSITVERYQDQLLAMDSLRTLWFANQVHVVVVLDDGEQAWSDVVYSNLPTPAYAPTDITIYVRLTGDDDTGDGKTIATAYRTFARGIRDVPNESVIPAGIIYRVDITGIGTETLPEMYEFPVFVGAEGIGDFDFTQRYFHYYNAVNIQATPKVATITGITSIVSAGTTDSVPKASTGLKRITHVGAGWVASALKGKFAIGAGLATEHSVIWENGTDWIDITATAVPTYPITIMDCSAHLTADKDASDLHRAAINIKNSAIGLMGIKVSSTGTGTGGVSTFSNWGLQTSGTYPVSLQLCEIDGAGFLTKEWTRARQCYLPNALFMMAPNLLNQCYMYRSMEVVPSGPRVTVWGARGADSMFRKTVIEACTTIRFRDLFDTHESGPVNYVQMNYVQILNPIEDFPDILGHVQDGIYWTGMQLRLLGVDITRTAADPLFNAGNAITVKGNGAWVTMQGVTGTGFDLGASVVDGGYVEQDDRGGTATTLGKTVGARSFKSGGLAINAAWPAVTYPTVASAFPDFADALTSQGTRVWRKS